MVKCILAAINLLDGVFWGINSPCVFVLIENRKVIS